jgi:hypothetical protein
MVLDVEDPERRGEAVSNVLRSSQNMIEPTKFDTQKVKKGRDDEGEKVNSSFSPLIKPSIWCSMLRLQKDKEKSVSSFFRNRQNMIE